MNKKTALLALFGVLNFAPIAFGQFFFLVEKQQRFDQTGNATTAADASAPFRFQVQIGSSGNNTESPTNPPPPNEFTFAGNPSPISLSPPSDSNSQWQYRGDFNVQADMDAAFPNGNFTLNIGGNTGNVALNGDLYTNIPQAGFSVGGNWSGNIYSIFGGQDLVINTNSIAGFTSGNFRVGIDASPAGGFSGNQSDIQFDSFDGGLVDSSGNITIPASLLQAGQSWDVSLDFNAFASLSNSTFPGNTSVGLYTVQTRFTVAAVPEPAETALLIGLSAIGLAAWRRRKSVA
jgi:hypothetical protein